MTNAIKPPGSGAGPNPVVSRQASDMGDAARVQGATATIASEAPSAASASSPHAALAEQLRRGELTAGQVVDAVVTKALEQARAQGLPASEQANLESVLRDALANDPTLLGLTRELER